MSYSYKTYLLVLRSITMKIQFFYYQSSSCYGTLHSVPNAGADTGGHPLPSRINKISLPEDLIFCIFNYQKVQFPPSSGGTEIPQGEKCLNSTLDLRFNVF